LPGQPKISFDFHLPSQWAFSVTGALTDRYCIWSGGKLFSHTSVDDSASLSPQPLLSCGEPDGACNGGNSGHAWEFMQANGTLTCRRQQTQCVSSPRVPTLHFWIVYS
jgi:hypothetical protein